MTVSVALVSTIMGLIGAVSGLIAALARFKVEPLYSLLIGVSPSLRQLQEAREALDERRAIKIRDEQELLELVHRIAAEEYDSISKRYTPVEFKWTHQGFEIWYANQVKDIRKNSPGIQDKMVGYVDERIEKRLGRVAVTGGVIAVVGFTGAVIAFLL